MYDNYQNDSVRYSADTALTYSEYLGGTFRWMGMGLGITFLVAYATAFTGLFNLVYSLYLPLTIAELALVFILSARVQSMQVSTARGLFLGYAALNGMVLSLYFVIFDLSTLVMAFLAACLYFGLTALYGMTTHRDLTSWGPRLFAGLIAMLVCGFAGLLFGFGFVNSLLYSGLGVLLFMLLTAYDTQKLQHYYYYYSRDPEMAEKSSIYGALSLYLDFINIFLYLVRIFGRGNSRRN